MELPPAGRVPDADLYQLPLPDLHSLVRKLENDKLSLANDHNNLIKDVNKRMQIHLLEIRGLKDVNQRLQDESQELRDLCVFLDDDRQKSRKLAREWQRFGRYTSSVMKSEVSAYQEKLKELELRQNELMKENIELKELCLYLDEERSSRNLNTSGSRDQGDGSSISSLTNEALDDVTVNDVTSPQKKTVEVEEKLLVSPAKSTIDDHTGQYIQQLENHIKTLEDQLAHVDVRIPVADWSAPPSEAALSPPDSDGRSRPSDSGKSPAKPEATVYAMQGLDARSQLEQICEGRYDEGLSEVERAVVRQMCLVAKRKLEEDPSSDKSVQQPSPVDARNQSPRNSNLYYVPRDSKITNSSTDSKYNSTDHDSRESKFSNFENSGNSAKSSLHNSDERLSDHYRDSRTVIGPQGHRHPARIPDHYSRDPYSRDNNNARDQRNSGQNDYSNHYQEGMQYGSKMVNGPPKPDRLMDRPLGAPVLRGPAQGAPPRGPPPDYHARYGSAPVNTRYHQNQQEWRPGPRQ